ncbi:MAG: hypothetical protein IPG33_13035 [Betaproteobacteria bacterium]|nr:hypothetical protein [Betaproteobacteria bacterium]
MTLSKEIVNRLMYPLLSAALCVLAVISCGTASAQPRMDGGAPFDHNATGFILEGAHVRERCESCHTQGAFRGTPRDCASCHRPGSRAPGKPASHIPTNVQCDSCHFSASWTPANFRHRTTQGVMPGSCNACHGGITAPGKPATHVTTTAPCDTCHKTSSWLPAGYSHALVAPGSCASCHNGIRATGKPARHIPTNAACDACHAPGIAFVPVSVGIGTMHANMSGPAAAGNCSTCHSGAFLAQNAQVKPTTHVATSAQCDTCHASTTSWATATFNHATASPPAAGRCSNCHNGSNALGKPTNHIPTGAQCDTCHANTTAFKPSRMDHVGTAGQCTSCHSGAHTFANALAKPATHIPTAAQCDTCHASGFINWSPATMNHAGMAGKCITCHSGGFLSQNAQTKPATHIATTAQCDSCHKSTTTWATVTFNHANASPPAAGRCSSCHNSVSALGKPVTHIPTGAQCDSCHSNFTAFRPAQMNHMGTTGQCSTCHNGSYLFANALARPPSHIPSTAQCDTCHINGFAAWSPATMNHSGLARLCSNCHSGAYLSQNAQVKPPTHVATAAQCDTCHTSTISWATAIYAHDASANGQCATCHNSVTALGKPSNHIPTTAQCDSCHSGFSAFRPARMNHAGTSGQCSSCHSGAHVFANALAKPANHIPTITQCDTCHTGGFTAWSPSTMNHGGLAGQCATCHSGAYLAQNAQAKTPTHIPTTAQCDTCHSSTVSWATATFNHATASPPAAGRCSNCHNGTNAMGKPTNHIPTTAQCDTCHTSFTAFAPAVMNHAGTTNQCASCHSGTYTFANALAKPGTHILTTAQCDTCHFSTITWSGATYTHGAGATGTCSTCHNGIAAIGKPPTHIPTSLQCDNCHTNYSAFKPAKMNHAGTNGQCSTCHGGSYTAMNALAKPATHIPTTGQCDTCHVNGYIAWSPSTMNHGGLAGQCATCHSGAYLAQNAQAKTPTHIPTTAQCDTCHNSTVSWATATFNHATASPPAAGRCSNCHNGTNALGKPTSHIPTTAQCDTCHKVYTSFAPATMSHSGTTGPVAAGNCATCHNGAYKSVNAQAKPATHLPTAQSCDACHATTAWKPTSFSHTGIAPGTCATCHNGTNALGKPASHIPTAAQCDTCHKSFASFAPALMSHGGTTGPVAAGNCVTCHSGTYLAQNAQVKPATHVPTVQQCDTCHKSTTTWATATYTHDAAAVGNCATCHNSVTALGKPTTHIPTNAQCSTCHTNYVAFRPAQMSHPGATGPAATGNCSTCHGGSYTAMNALAKPATHIPTTGQCDTCHVNGYIAWSPSTMNHGGLAGQCATCHSGAYLAQNAQAKTPTHIPTTAQCDTCHSSTVSWATATFNHATASPPAAGRCSNCHNGTNALGKPTSHIPTTAQCDTCHQGHTSFAPATMSRSGTTGPVAAGNCATCHNGAYKSVNAQTKPATHLPTAQSCDACHATTAWKPTSFSHTGIAPGSCATCHNGVSASGKPALHIPTTQPCDTCHRTGLAWLPVITPYSHAGIAAGSCATCHGGAYPNITVKPAMHVPTNLACDSCHHNYAAWLPTTFNHTGVVNGTCQTCHGGAYPSITVKPANHIPTTMPAGMPGNECSLCHSSKTTFAVAKMNHGTMQTSCAICHDATSPYAGDMKKINRANHHNAGAKDCSSSGCHRPLGSKGTAYTKWN